MKGIVLEELKDKLIVLTDKGDFIEIDKLSEKVEIGEEIVIKGQKTNIKKTLKRSALAAAVFCMVMLGSYTAYASLVTQGYVSISINPSDNKSASMEMAYNSFGKIIKFHCPLRVRGRKKASSITNETSIHQSSSLVAKPSHSDSAFLVLPGRRGLASSEDPFCGITSIHPTSTAKGNGAEKLTPRASQRGSPRSHICV